MTHTPGPWALEISPLECGSPQTWWVYGNKGWDSVGEVNHEADARLIAAAPELLEALKAATNYIKKLDPDNGCEALYTAIAKADGKS